jgi:hypothetical protein
MNGTAAVAAGPPMTVMSPWPDMLMTRPLAATGVRRG